MDNDLMTILAQDTLSTIKDLLDGTIYRADKDSILYAIHNASGAYVKVVHAIENAHRVLSDIRS